MTEIDPKNQATPENRRNLEPVPDSNRTPDGDYIVGKNRPPLHTRFKPGQSGNPRGRPKGRRNVKSEIKRAIDKKVKIRVGDQEQHVSLVTANMLTHALKGAKGDPRSTRLFLNNAFKFGLLEDDDEARTAFQGSVEVHSNFARPSDRLLENLDLTFLTREEKIELSRLASFIDLGGDFTALADADLLRFKDLVNKGRGKDVSPH